MDFLALYVDLCVCVYGTIYFGNENENEEKTRKYTNTQPIVSELEEYYSLESVNLMYALDCKCAGVTFPCP